MGDPGSEPEVTLEDAMRVFEKLSQPGTPMTAVEIAEKLDCSRRTAHRKLMELSDRGDLRTKKAGARSRIWWRTNSSAQSLGIDPGESPNDSELYRLTLANLSDTVLITDDDGAFRYVCPNVHFIFDYSAEEVREMGKVDQLLGDSLVDPEEIHNVGEISNIERTVKDRNGDEHDLLVTVKSVDINGGRVLYACRDITERREFEERAQQQAANSDLGQYALEDPALDELFLEASRAVAEALDNDYCKVLDLDEEAENLLLRQGVGWQDGIVGTATVSAVEADSQASYTLISEEPVVVSDLETETRFSGPDLLTSHDVRSGISTIIGTVDDPWGILGTHDTERKSFSEKDVAFVQSVANILAEAIKRRQYQEESEELIEALEESNERLEQFAYAASHDLQEPLRMITNYLQLLERRYADGLDDEAQEFIEFAVDGADRMRKMVDDLLAYSRIDTEAEPFEPTDTETIVENVLRDLKFRIDETGAEIDVHSLPTVQADPNQLEQVFQNLLSNALKYHGEESPEIEISADRAVTEWVFQVADNGIGMEPEQTDRIFEVFDRLHTRDEYPGTGIGLALCRKIVERHGGEIWVESVPDEGSTFYFTFPTTEVGRQSN